MGVTAGKTAWDSRMNVDFKQKEVVCKVDRVVYPRDEENPSVRQFRIIKTDVGTVKGQITWRPQTGERLRLTARGDRDGWHISNYNGEPEFSFSVALPDVPQDERAALHYACELTRGLGPAAEEAIWDALGEKWREIGPDSVKKPRLSASVLNAFHATIDELALQKEKLDAIAFVLHIAGPGATRLAEAAWERWKEKTISKIRENCYCLADLSHFSFRDVDGKIRESFQIGLTDRRRTDAAVRYYLNQLCADSTVCSWINLYQAVERAINVGSVAIADSVRAMFAAGKLVGFRHYDAAGNVDPNASTIALARDAEDEREILQYARGGVA